jgi:hypothetical protein
MISNGNPQTQYHQILISLGGCFPRHMVVSSCRAKRVVLLPKHSRIDEVVRLDREPKLEQ